jgi:hypothetical protein
MDGGTGVMLTFEDPPESDDAIVPTKMAIAAELDSHPGKWAVVARCDRAMRATALAARINGGTEYCTGFEAVYRRVGNEHRVYARRNVVR